jgi:excisionase family DNA binding protein
MTQLCVDRAEAARLLGVSKLTIWRLVSRGLLCPIRIGRKCVRYRVADLERLIEKLSDGPGRRQRRRACHGK